MEVRLLPSALQSPFPEFLEYKHFLERVKSFNAGVTTPDQESEVKEQNKAAFWFFDKEEFKKKIENDRDLLNMAILFLKNLFYFQQEALELQTKLRSQQGSESVSNSIRTATAQLWHACLAWGQKILSHTEGYDPVLPKVNQFALRDRYMRTLVDTMEKAATACQSPRLQHLQALVEAIEKIPSEPEPLGRVTQIRNAHHKYARNQARMAFAGAAFCFAGAVGFILLTVYGFSHITPDPELALGFLIPAATALIGAIYFLWEGKKFHTDAARFRQGISDSLQEELKPEQKLVNQTKVSFSAFKSHLEKGAGLFEQPEQKMPEQKAEPVKNMKFYMGRVTSKLCRR